MEYLQQMERRFSSLAGCYALFAALVASFLVYTHLALQSHPHDEWSGLPARLLNGSVLPRDLHAAQVVSATLAAASAFRERMHTTWFFFGVFAAVWLACLLWMQFERRRRRLSFNRREAFWMGWMSLSVLAAAVLYGLGTNGVFTRRFPGIVPVSDVLAAGFMLALPVVAWSRLNRQEEEGADEESDEADLLPRSSGMLGLNDDAANARLVESFSKLEVRPEVRPVDLLPAVQIFHPERPGELAKAAASRLIESAELPIPPEAPLPEPSLPVPPFPSSPPAVAAPVAETAAQPPAKGIDEFRNQLSALNSSWQRIEAIRGEIDDWFEQRRREAIAHLETHPGMRGPHLTANLFQDFPNDKLAAVDTEWAEIRQAALEISRWFGDVPAPVSGT